MLQKIKLWASVALIAVWMLGGAYGHFFKPEFFYAIVPDLLPKKQVVYASGVPELLIGLAVLFPRTRALAGLGFAVLCLALLPLHIWDAFRDTPAFSPLSLAITRIGVQLILIAIGWRLWRQRQTGL